MQFSRMQGLDFKGLKKHPSLLPLFFMLGLGCCTAIVCGIRTSLKNPEVSWSAKRNPEPWNEYHDKDYKYYDPKGSVVAVRNRRYSIWDLIKGSET